MLDQKAKLVRLTFRALSIFPDIAQKLSSEAQATGVSTAAALGHGKPKTIFLAGRNPAKSSPVIQGIQKTDRNIKVIFVELDLSDLDSVRKAAKEILTVEKRKQLMP